MYFNNYMFRKTKGKNKLLKKTVTGITCRCLNNQYFVRLDEDNGKAYIIYTCLKCGRVCHKKLNFLEESFDNYSTYI